MKIILMIQIFFLMSGCNDYKSESNSDVLTNEDFYVRKTRNDSLNNFIKSFNSMATSTSSDKRLGITKLFKNFSELIEENDYNELWENCFSTGFKSKYSQEYFISSLNNEWEFEKLIPLQVFIYDGTARIIFKANDRGNNKSYVYTDVIYLINENGWKLENFPFEGSGFFDFETPPAFLDSIWRK